MPNLKILVTGASGYIGSQLIPLLMKAGHTVRCLSRRPEGHPVPAGVERVQADVLDRVSLSRAFKGVDVAYYLIHSMEKAPGDPRSFAERDREAASNFAQEARKANVRRIIYLGGLGEAGKDLSEHLASRMEVGKILQAGKVPTTVFRAAIILGALGSSFRMIQSLVERLPVMICPRWVQTPCQPIALEDVLYYLVRCLDVPGTEGRAFDVGGPDVLSYRDMMLRFAKVLGKKRLIFGVPILTPRLSSYWVDLVTPIPASLARPLIDGLRNAAVCGNTGIAHIMPHDCLGYEESITRALEEQGRGTLVRKGRTYHLTWQQRVPHPAGDVMACFGNPKNLLQMTPASFYFQLIPPFPDRLASGDQLRYRFRMLGIPVRWAAEIIEWEPPKRFRDVQRKGPYRLWEHTHVFEATKEGTRVNDYVRYELPLGWIGQLFHPLIVAWQIRKIFRFRSRQLTRLLMLKR